MYKDYVELIAETFRREKAANNLSLNLMRPTTAKIKQECFTRLEEGLEPRDEKTIRAFFGTWASKKDLLQRVEQFKNSKFRPLVTFINKDFKRTTHDKNIELLAWLIKLEDRPFDEEKEHEILLEELKKMPIGPKPKNSHEHPLKPTETNNYERERIPPTNQTTSVSVFTFSQMRFISILIFAIVVIGTFWLKKEPATAANSIASGCMYWTGDHYEPIPCHQKIPGAIVVALDSQRLKEFKRVTRPDTITYASIGKLFYHKPKRDSVDFYTTSGYHPTLHNRYLHQATKYMIDKYVLKKVQLTARD